jgi:son of sevenless-like protein
VDDFDLPKRKKGNNQSKMERILGTAVPVHIVNQINADSTPWYLRPDYKEDQINMDNADGSVKHGTVEALIERLTAHDNPGKHISQFPQLLC